MPAAYKGLKAGVEVSEGASANTYLKGGWVVGWAMANHLRTELVLDAFNMALGQRRATSVIHHSDSESLGAGSSLAT